MDPELQKILQSIAAAPQVKDSGEAPTSFPGVDFGLLVQQQQEPSPAGSSSNGTDEISTSIKRQFEDEKPSSHPHRSDSEGASKLAARRTSADADASGVDGEQHEFSGASRGTRRTSEKRKEQNRNAQRAFRARKEHRLQELEEQVSAITLREEKTAAENANLRTLVRALQAENSRLVSTQGTALNSSLAPIFAPQPSSSLGPHRPSTNATSSGPSGDRRASGGGGGDDPSPVSPRASIPGPPTTPNGGLDFSALVRSITEQRREGSSGGGSDSLQSANSGGTTSTPTSEQRQPSLNLATQQRPPTTVEPRRLSRDNGTSNGISGTPNFSVPWSSYQLPTASPNPTLPQSTSPVQEISSMPSPSSLGGQSSFSPTMPLSIPPFLLPTSAENAVASQLPAASASSSTGDSSAIPGMPGFGFLGYLGQDGDTDMTDLSFLNQWDPNTMSLVSDDPASFIAGGLDFSGFTPGATDPTGSSVF